MQHCRGREVSWEYCDGLYGVVSQYDEAEKTGCQQILPLYIMIIFYELDDGNDGDRNQPGEHTDGLCADYGVAA